MQRFFETLDWPTLAGTFAILVVSIVSIASATMDESGGGLWKVQIAYLLLALAATAVVIVIDYRVWAGIALLLHGIAIALLVATLFFGTQIGGNKSWLVVGSFRLGQPSELAKWTTCLVVAVYLAQRARETLRISQMITLGGLVGLPVVLIALQPDHGTALVFVPIFLAALLIGGVRWKILAVLLLAGVCSAPIVWTQLKPYQKERILNVLDSSRDPSGSGYQVRQSKIAIGSGGVFGKGPFRGTQSQLNFLPAQHTDFIIAVIAEELGFIGVGAVLGLLYFVMVRAMAIAQGAQDRLGTYICLLIVAWLAGQTAINVGMVLGRLPTIGVPLPLVSYGGTSLLATMAGLGLVLNVRARRFVN